MYLIFRIIAKWEVAVNNSSPWQHPELTTTGFTEPNLVFREHALKEQTTYQMNLEAHFEGSPEHRSQFALSFVTSRTPTQGSCNVRYHFFIFFFYQIINSAEANLEG